MFSDERIGSCLEYLKTKIIPKPTKAFCKAFPPRYSRYWVIGERVHFTFQSPFHKPEQRIGFAFKKYKLC